MKGVAIVLGVVLVFGSGSRASPALLLADDLPPKSDASTSRPISFLAAAKDVTATIQKTLYNPKTGLYAQSATKRDPEFMWGNGILFSALVAAARHEPETYRPVMNRFFASMDRYWDKKAKIPGYEPSPTAGNGNDKYYDDNAWMVLTFLEAYDQTHEPKFLLRANQTLRFTLSGWDDQLGGGIWWHELHKDNGKNTCINAPAAVACLRMARHREEEVNVEWAKRIVTWTNKHLQDDDGLFFDHIKVDTGKVDKVKLTYNTALMLRANIGLYRATGDTIYIEEAKRIGAACDWFTGKTTGAYRDAFKWSHLQVEADLELYRATGSEAALARAKRNGEYAYERWQTDRPEETIEQASIARMLWLLADLETDAGKAFWAESDRETHPKP